MKMQTIMEMIADVQRDNDESSMFQNFNRLSQTSHESVDKKAAAEGYAIRIMRSIGPRPFAKGKSSCHPKRTAVWQTLSPERKDELANQG